MATRTYNPAVRVGNWIEDVQLEEDIIKDFQEKKDAGELLIQKTHNVMNNLLRQEKLSAQTENKHLMFGSRINLCHIASGTVLSSKVSELKSRTSSQLKSPCDMSASLMTNPCPRNVFQICSADGEILKKPLCYGQKFVLKTLPGPGGELSLWSDRATFTKCAAKSRLPVVQLHDDSSYNVVWQFHCRNPLIRMEMEGNPVVVGDTIILNHCKTNQNLACMSQYQRRTPYGQEMEVCCKTFLDSHKAETEENLWTIVVNKPE
ncbi:cilia- and flagella-associated protein 161-like [Bolinopsis microptera]|uniref:cilia- and flagella-associated protein 161-like n=1 Tax=Bolinopsis microptera TaxID=2820187 RepID=UPI00307979C9